jgi:hypothetical protein
VFYLCIAAGSLPDKVCAVRTAGYCKPYKKFTLYITMNNYFFVTFIWVELEGIYTGP